MAENNTSELIERFNEIDSRVNLDTKNNKKYAEIKKKILRNNYKWKLIGSHIA